MNRTYLETARLLIQVALVQTARANEIKPYAYLRRLFAELPAARSVADFKAQLPFSAMN
jgi:hypothetical protein